MADPDRSDVRPSRQDVQVRREGIPSTKLSGPALAPDDIGPLHAVLLSHDHHADDLTISIEAHVAFTA
jgi:hypothetical protein